MKTILVTGASTGFGSNVALALAQQGWRVFASMRDTAKGAALIEETRRTQAPGSIDLIAMDVTSNDSVGAGVEQMLAATGGQIDALLNNAGFSLLGAFEDMSDAQCRQQMETNFFGALAVTRAVLPSMRAAKSGRIVVVTSNAVNTPHPMLSLYAASKWALEGWAEGLAMEMAPFGVGVVVVQPGAHRTPFASNVVPVVPEGSAYAGWMEQATPGVSNLDRWGRPAEAATDAILTALTDPSPAFRTAIGGDAEIFAALKGALPFELRAALLRAIVGLPAPGAFTGQPVAEPTLQPAVHALLAAVSQSPELRQTIASVVCDALVPVRK
ncbi:SDR family oxidoreductase [Sphingobium aromaticivastans]|uniref:SDR family oxidoreductase n=1 Tax=Sphingobium aromaticivastans TaxID=1778665 RepID=UPI0030165B5F